MDKSSASDRRHASPLRYPGGKSKLTPYLKRIFSDNQLIGGHYAEPYAGGASVALSLLFDEYASTIHINDLDRSIHAFWHSVIHETDALCRLVQSVRITPATWRRQRAIQDDASASMLERGFSTFFLNRTNRSGIITGGMIGGLEQAGEWRLDARFNRPALIARIERVASYGDRIKLSRLDASTFLLKRVPLMPKRSLVYLDPPYFVKGQQRLYANYYEPSDHADIANIVVGLERPWLVSYDNAPEIRRLYSPHRRLFYGLDYTAARRYEGSEVMFFAFGLAVPRVKDPISFGRAKRRNGVRGSVP
jgi:DNA adenine methylase